MLSRGGQINNKDFFAEYDVLQRLDAGSSSTVFLVRRRNLQKAMVMKVMERTEASKQQYQHEIQILKNLSIPGVPELYDYGEDEKSFVIVEEFIPGKSLQSILLQSISQEQLINYSKQIAAIIGSLHSHGYLYLDMKQEHIVVEQEQVYLLDYGLARLADHGMVRGTFYGTVPYASPEQQYEHYATMESDIYSLGVVYKEMISAVRACNKEVRSSYLAMVERMTKQETNLRIASIAEVLSILSELERIEKDSVLGCPEMKIAVVGSEHRVGVTFLSTYMTSCLNMARQNACYYENHEYRWILGSTMNKARRPRVLPCRIGKLKAIPDYGPFLCKEEIASAIRKKATPRIGVYDLGVLKEETDLHSYDFIFLVLGARPWEQVHSLNAMDLLPKDKKVQLFCNLVTKREASQLAKMIGEGVYRIGAVEDIYSPSKKEVQLMVRVLKGF